jgi:hypothetical protein
LSITIPLVPPATLADVCVVSLAKAMTQPVTPKPGQLRDTPQKSLVPPAHLIEEFGNGVRELPHGVTNGRPRRQDSSAIETPEIPEGLCGSASATNEHMSGGGVI